MNKFKIGDEVVYVNQICEEPPYEIEIGKVYTVDGIIGDRCVTLEGIGGMFPAWQEERFELFSEWAAHQVPVNTETELTLTKLQVKMLQDWKKDALYLLNCVEDEGSSPCFKDMVKYFLDNNKLKGFYD